MESVFAGDRNEGSNPSPSATVIMHSDIESRGQLAVQFKIELPALLGGAGDDPVDEAPQRH